MNRLWCCIMVVAVVVIVILQAQKIPELATERVPFVESCWNLPVSMTDRPISSSTIWLMGAISRRDELHSKLVASYASQSELSPAARQGFCVSLEKLQEPHPAESHQAPCESSDKLSHLTPAGRQEFCAYLEKVSAPAPVEPTISTDPEAKG